MGGRPDDLLLDEPLVADAGDAAAGLLRLTNSPPGSFVPYLIRHDEEDAAANDDGKGDDAAGSHGCI